MVSDDAYRDRPRSRSERAQLLLVGAIAIALVLIGLVVVFNTVLYTDTTSPTETLEAADEAETLNQQVRNDTRRILWIVANETGEDDCTTNYCTMVEQNISTYSEGLTQSTGQTGPVFVEIRVNSIAGTAGGLGGDCSTGNLCADFTFIYETDQFRYKRSQVVEIPPP
jgi:hypothetical protein